MNHPITADTDELARRNHTDRWSRVLRPLGLIHWEGVVLAFVGFTITRVFVAEAVVLNAALPFLLTGVLPLVVGLAVTVVGVVLAVGAFPRAYARHVTIGALGGTIAISFVLLLTASGELVRQGDVTNSFGSGLLVANVMLGGLVGGMVISHRSAETERQRAAIDRKSNRSLLVNRLLKHDVINAITIIDGYVTVLSEGSDQEAVRTIQSAIGGIERTIDEIGTIAAETERSSFGEIDVPEQVVAEIRRLERERTVRVDLDDRTTDPHAVVGGNVGVVVRELLENAFDHGVDDRVEVTLDGSNEHLRLAVANAGPPLPTNQRELLEDGKFPEYDDPTAGFGLQFVRLLVDRYGGSIRVVDDDGTRIVVDFPRSRGGLDITATVGLAFPNLYNAAIAGTVAGVAMGVVYAVSTGMLPVIGALYGVEDPVVGWITHLFHSIVFALLFAAGIDRLGTIHEHPSSRMALFGAGWGTILWLVAAGVVMPIWFWAVGLDVPIPNLEAVGWLAHLVWGVTMAVVYHRLANRRR